MKLTLMWEVVILILKSVISNCVIKVHSEY